MPRVLDTGRPERVVGARSKYWTPEVCSGRLEEIPDARGAGHWAPGASTGCPEQIVDARSAGHWVPEASTGRVEQTLNTRSLWRVPGANTVRPECWILETLANVTPPPPPPREEPSVERKKPVECPPPYRTQSTQPAQEGSKSQPESRQEDLHGHLLIGLCSRAR